MKQTTTIEPGLLPLFRSLTLIRLTLALIAVVGLILEQEPALSTLRSQIVLGNFLEGLVLWLYLSWPRLRTWLKRAYLPIGIVLASVGPMLVVHSLRPNTTMEALEAVARVWQTLPSLLIVLVMIAWQYKFGTVLIYCVSTAVVELGIVRVFNPPGEMHLLLFGTEAEKPWRFLALLVVFLNRYMILIAIGFMVTRLMKTQREQRTALMQANVSLTNYTVTLEQLTTSRERNRLARELHDTLAHTLSALAVQLGAVDALWDDAPDEARDLLSQSLVMTRDGLTETRRALHDLRATPLEDMGLPLALRALADSFASRNGIALIVELPDHITLTPPVEQGVYRIAQEALENISRHAAAHTATLRLTTTDENVTLTIHDDGRGFDPDNISDKHLGLQGMRERAEMIEGMLTVNSTSEQGTTVTLIVQEP